MKEPSIFRAVEASALFRWVRNRLNRRLAAFFRSEVFPGRSRAVVLEAGCGTGYATELLASEPGVALSVGLDISLEIHQRSGISLSRGRLIVGDIYALPFPDGTFDLVWNSSTIEETADPRAAAASMSRVAGKGGYVFVGVPYLWGPLGVYHLLPFKPLREWLGRPFSLRRLREMLAGIGLAEEKRIKYLGGCFIGLLARKR